MWLSAFHVCLSFAKGIEVVSIRKMPCINVLHRHRHHHHPHHHHLHSLRAPELWAGKLATWNMSVSMVFIVFLATDSPLKKLMSTGSFFFLSSSPCSSKTPPPLPPSPQAKKIDCSCTVRQHVRMLSIQFKISLRHSILWADTSTSREDSDFAETFSPFKEISFGLQLRGLSARIPLSHGQGHNGHNGPINQNTQIKLQQTVRSSIPSSLPYPYPSSLPYPYRMFLLFGLHSFLSSQRNSTHCTFSFFHSMIHPFLLPFFLSSSPTLPTFSCLYLFFSLLLHPFIPSSIFLH